MKVVIAGGRGMLGAALGGALRADGIDVVALSRRQPPGALADGQRVVRWDGRTLDGAWTQELAGADAVVDVCGLSVGTWPWTPGTMARLRGSRLEPRTVLVEAMAGLVPDARPRSLVAISGTDGYVGTDALPAGEDTPLADTFL
ncbi:MAG: NAD-dependent epimerase/dehydratase family protein, partial [Candidatus Limnocylindrales bacterium]